MILQNEQAVIHVHNRQRSETHLHQEIGKLTISTLKSFCVSFYSRRNYDIRCEQVKRGASVSKELALFN